jgi:dimethylhistidine N-methyltransferase
VPITLTNTRNLSNRPQLYRYPIDEQSATEEILGGLTQPQKTLHPKYFYDAEGARLFDRITYLPSYYLSRAEQEILRRYCPAISAYTGTDCVLIEPGAGTCDKVELLLPSLRPAAYVPIDIAEGCLHDAAQRLAEQFPWLECHAISADFSASFELPEHLPSGRRVAFYPGSSIGNYEPAAARDFLRSVRAVVGDDGGLLIGVDLRKPTWQLHSAYNDSQGITAAFNRNILNHVNHLTGSAIPVDNFDHLAFYDSQRGRIEMHLRSRYAQTITIGDTDIEFTEGETIHTENSYKYTIPAFCEMVESAGFEHQQTWCDADKLFSVHYFASKPESGLRSGMHMSGSKISLV